jgi:O-antigen/teichoic acid export membrane protein
MRVLLRRTTGICLVAFLGAAVYAYVLPPLAPMIFGERYSESTAVARLLCLHQGLTLIYAPLVIVGYGFGLAAAYVWLYLAQLAAVAVLTLLLVPGYGAAGAAIAWIAHDVITIVVLACMLGAQYRRSRGALAAVDPA